MPESNHEFPAADNDEFKKKPGLATERFLNRFFTACP
jgi:hypothetical protein